MVWVARPLADAGVNVRWPRCQVAFGKNAQSISAHQNPNTPVEKGGLGDFHVYGLSEKKPSTTTSLNNGIE
jgi:hypothetical protein